MEITSRKNQYIKEYRELTSQRKARRESGFFAVEGKKLCEEAIKSKCTLGRFAFVTKKAEEKYPDTVKMLAELTEIFTIPDDIAEYISDTVSPQGIFITVKYLDKILKFDKIKDSGKFLILENLQDTGNIGTIIRTADAFSLDGVILSEDSADVFSPKTVRSTMGSVFRVPIYICDVSEAVKMLQDNKFTVYTAMLDKNAEKLGSFSFSEKAAVVIGNEGNGVTKELASQCDKSVFIPMDSAESLNASVAASIIAWEMKK